MCQVRYTWTRRIESLWNKICVSFSSSLSLFLLVLPLMDIWFVSFEDGVSLFAFCTLAYGQVRTLALLVTQQNRTRRGIVRRISCLIWIKQIETNERKCLCSIQVSRCYFYCILSFTKSVWTWMKETDKRLPLSSNDYSTLSGFFHRVISD